MGVVRRLVAGFGWVLGIYLIGRAIVEVLVIDYGDPGSYRGDWGGPGLIGVLAVHCGPGLVALVLFGVWLRSRLRRRSAHGVDVGQ